MELSTQFIHWLKQRDEAQCHRQLLIINGDRDWAAATSLKVLERYSHSKALWVGETTGNVECINVNDYRTKLGHEFGIVILDCFSGFRANAAMALSGTVKANGLMIMLCPPLSDWVNYSDPEQINRISYGYHSANNKSYFFAYLSSKFVSDRDVAILSPEQFSGSPAWIKQMDNPDRLIQQHSAVESICKVALGHRNRPLIFTADRGRGKSSALGIAAARLIKNTNKSIWVTSSNISAVEQVFTHCKRLLPNSTATHKSVTAYSGSLTFKPFDVVIEQDNTPDLLLVDEAASIPIHLLIRLAAKFPRIVFTTTMHGYEGSGRGFQIRFIKQLEQIKPEYKKVHLAEPIRWLEHDSLERFWFATLHHTTKSDKDAVTELDQIIKCENITQASLHTNKSLMSAVFNLLVSAHYQTSPDDLQRILDAPESKVFVLRRGEQIIGVAQVLQEGGQVLQEIAVDIATNQRRVKGHLVAQNLASTYNLPTLCTCKQWRISRIAVHPKFQRLGYGTRLLKEIDKKARLEEIELLTTAFGINYELLTFWQTLGYLPAKLSLKKEVSSGEHSFIAIKPFSTSTKTIIKTITSEFFQDLHFSLDKDYQHISANIVIKLLLNYDVYQPSEHQLSIISQFVSGARNMSSCKRILKCGVLTKINHLSTLDATEQELIITTLLQGHQNIWLCQNFNISGKKELEKKIRQILAKLFSE